MVQSGYDQKGGLDGKGSIDLTKVVFELGGGTLPPDFGDGGLETCSEQSGHICTQQETCPGTWLSASDTSRCCSVSCQTGQVPLDKIDLNCDNLIDVADFGILLSWWGKQGSAIVSYQNIYCPPSTSKSLDLSPNGIIDSQDISVILSNWGKRE